jgi:hypothetical protein
VTTNIVGIAAAVVAGAGLAVTSAVRRLVRRSASVA